MTVLPLTMLNWAGVYLGRLTALGLALGSCGPSGERQDKTNVTSPAPAPPHTADVEAQSSAAPANTKVAERWGCRREEHPLADFHHATLDLREDASFELRHTHTTPERGWTSWMKGRWARVDGALVLTPVSARRRRWIGDGHRHQHGENVPYDEWEETMTTQPWRPVAGDAPGIGASLSVPEIATTVYRVASDDYQFPPCDPGPPPRASRPR